MSVSRENSYSPSESFEYKALQSAAAAGSIDQIRYLIQNGTELNSGPDPALHLALRKQHIQIARLLLQAGAEHECRDSKGDYPIHIACTLGLVDIVRVLCTLGCNLEVPNAKGLYPLHLASKYGHIHVVRYLCSAGCNVDVRNADNIRADITALKYGHNNISELLDRLRATGQRDAFARQLVPTSKSSVTPSLRLLGNCGIGKTSVMKSLSAGLFTTLFKRSSSLHSNKSRPSSPINGQIEMDVTSRQNSLSFESSANYQSTNGIHVRTLDISGVNEVSVWDFSGQENYFPLYHHFLLPNPHCLTAVLFSLDDPPSVQVQQVSFWLNFLMARQPADCPSGNLGDIVLIATHVDKTRAGKGQHGEWISPDAQKTLQTVKKTMSYIPNLKSNVIVLDSNVPASYGFKQLKCMLSSIKQDNVLKSIGTWTGLLEATLSWLKVLQKQYEQFPVLSRSTFSEILRTQVNLLASDEHVDELLQQLSYMGEVFCIYDHIVISISWLGTELLGELLSANFLQHARVTGVYTAEDFQACFNQCDALGALSLLEDLSLCIRCDLEEDVEYEFPIYNRTETLEGLWDSDDPRYTGKSSHYGGVRLCTPPNTCHLLQSVFVFIQIDLRRATSANFSNNDSDMDLYQWYMGSKLCNVDLESLITLEEGNYAQFIEIKVRGPNNSSQYCFYFLEQILHTVFTSISRVCPGLLLERHILSPEDLRMHSEDPFLYHPHIINSAMLEAESTSDVVFYNANIGHYESVVQLVMFGDPELANGILWGCGLKVQDLPSAAKLKLCGLLDPPEPHGRDWCLLALRLGLNQEKIAALDSQYSSHTMRLLTITECSIGALITSLHDLDRLDAVEVVLRSAPIFKLRNDLD